jgi:ribokinase
MTSSAQALLDNLSAAGVGRQPSSEWTDPPAWRPILVAENGENSIVVVPGANGKVDPAYIDSQAELICSAGMVLCQLELPMDLL